LLTSLFRLIYLFVFCFSVFAATSSDVRPESQQTKWKAVERGFSLELVQVKDDYVRAVFLARGLPGDVVEKVSRYCVFGTIIKNHSDSPISSRLSGWRVVTIDGVEHKLKLKADWTREWSKKGIAFRWLILSEEQNFDAGDWIQGFSTIAVAPGKSFDLHYSWKQNGKTYNNEIKGVTCASASKN